MKTNFALIMTAAAVLAAAPQQFQINLDSLAGKASNVVDVSLSGATLKFAAKFLDSGAPEESSIKKLIGGLQGIYIKNFEFKQDKAWTQADLDPIRNQLKGPAWQRIIGVKSDDGENSEVYLHVEGDKNTGIAILVAEPREVTVINIVGPIDLEQLADLGGHFDVPKLHIPKKEKQK